MHVFPEETRGAGFSPKKRGCVRLASDGKRRSAFCSRRNVNASMAFPEGNAMGFASGTDACVPGGNKAGSRCVALKRHHRDPSPKAMHPGRGARGRERRWHALPGCMRLFICKLVVASHRPAVFPPGTSAARAFLKGT